LLVYLENPIVTPDNNMAENGIRPFVLGRKNWLFAGTPKGAEASALLYSLIETAKANNCEPYSLVRTAVNMHNKMSGLLMEVGAGYSKNRLRGRKYFHELLDRLDEIPPSVKELLMLSRAGFEMFQTFQKRLIQALRTNPLILERVNRLMTIAGVGEVTALTWVLEIGPVSRFGSIRQAISYCGLCSAQRESAGKQQRGPVSKKRNKHLQTILVEAAKLAPRWNPQLAEIHQRDLSRGNRNRATLAVARRLVAYMMAVDKSETNFAFREEQKAA
jgi:hypothetical protein